MEADDESGEDDIEDEELAEAMPWQQKSVEARAKKQDKDVSNAIDKDELAADENLCLLGKTGERKKNLAREVQKCQAEVDDLDDRLEKAIKTKFDVFTNDSELTGVR